MTTEPATHPQWTVRRSGRASRIGSTSLLVLGLALFAVPQGFAANIVQQLTSLLIFLILAAMWNALAGYGGLVSVGQQAYIGFGAYGTIFLTPHRVPAYPAIVLASLRSGGAGGPGF